MSQPGVGRFEQILKGEAKHIGGKTQCLCFGDFLGGRAFLIILCVFLIIIGIIGGFIYYRFTKIPNLSSFNKAIA